MASLRETRNALLVAYDSELIDDEQFLLLNDMNSSINDYPYWNYNKFNLEEMDDSETWTEFRFLKNDLYTLSVLKFAQYYLSRTPICANLSTARIFVRAKRSKIKNAKQQVHRDKRLGSSRNYYFFGNRRSPETRGSVYDATS